MELDDADFVAAALYRRDAYFSLAALLSENKSFKSVFGVVWIICGLFVLFFGLVSFRWLSSYRRESSPIPPAKRPRRLLGAGVGGLVIGFLGGTSLSLLAITSIATRRGSALTPGGLLVAWLLPGLILAPLTGHFAFLSRVVTGLLGSVNLVLLLTALGGIHTLTVRAALLVVAALLLTVPLLVPPNTRWRQVKGWLLNLHTSFVGAMTLLDGIALFTPPVATSESWVDLWTLLFAPDLGTSEATTVQQWGKVAFKGYIAGAILLILAGTAFEWYFHHCADEEVAEQWNDYLGVYAGQLEKEVEGSHSARYVPEIEQHRPHGEERAGMFEGPQSLWSRMKDQGRFRRGAPAAYGGYREGASTPFADQPMYTERTASVRSFRRSGRRPARYIPHEAEGDMDDDLSNLGGLPQWGRDDIDFESAREDLYTVRRESYQQLALPKHASLGMPRIPSYDSDSQPSQTSSLMSGSTAVDWASEELPRRYSKTLASPAAATSDESIPHQAQGQVAATPSLLNATERIQRAQQQTVDLENPRKQEDVS